MGPIFKGQALLLRDIPVERRSNLQDGGILKSRTIPNLLPFMTYPFLQQEPLGRLNTIARPLHVM